MFNCCIFIPIPLIKLSSVSSLVCAIHLYSQDIMNRTPRQRDFKSFLPVTVLVIILFQVA